MARFLRNRFFWKEERRAKREEKRRQKAKKRLATGQTRRDIVIKAVLCVLVFAVLAFPALFVNNIIGYVPALAFALLLIVSLAYALVQRASLSFEESSNISDCIRGQEAEIAVVFKNRSAVPFLRIEAVFYISDLFGDDDMLASESVSLAPFETYRFSFGVRFDHIGTYSAGLRKVIVHDLIGLFSFELKNDREQKIQVAPRVFDISDLKFNHEILTENPNAFAPLSDDGSDYMGVREYVIGDPMKTIHWKLSARGDVYYTKIYEVHGRPGIGVILDFHSPEYNAEDMMSVFDAVVESGLSMGSYALRNNMDFSLMYVNRMGVERKVDARNPSFDRIGLVMDMPRISSEDFTGIALKTLGRQSRSPYSESNLAICTSTIDDELVNALISVRSRRRNPVLVAVVPPSLNAEQRRSLARPLKRLEEANISYTMISSADTLEKEEVRL